MDAPPGAKTAPSTGALPFLVNNDSGALPALVVTSTSPAGTVATMVVRDTRAAPRKSGHTNVVVTTGAETGLGGARRCELGETIAPTSKATTIEQTTVAIDRCGLAVLKMSRTVSTNDWKVMRPALHR